MLQFKWISFHLNFQWGSLQTHLVHRLISSTGCMCSYLTTTLNKENIINLFLLFIKFQEVGWEMGKRISKNQHFWIAAVEYIWFRCHCSWLVTKEFSWILKIVFWTRFLFHHNQLKNNQYTRHVIFCLLLTYINNSQCYTSNVKSHHKHVHICTQIRSERVLTKILHELPCRSDLVDIS